MTLNTPVPTTPDVLARRARDQFVADLEVCIDKLSHVVGSRLQELVDRSPSTREAHIRRDALNQYDRERARWVERTGRALRKAAEPKVEPRQPRPMSLTLELIHDDVVEQGILASRLSMAIQEKAAWELNDLKFRMQTLEGGDDLPPGDVLRPDSLAQLLIEQWVQSGLSRQTWILVTETIQQQVLPAVVEAYGRINHQLVQAGVVPDVDAARRLKRAGGSPTSSQAAPAAQDPRFGGHGGSDPGSALPAASSGHPAPAQAQTAPPPYGPAAAHGGWAPGAPDPNGWQSGGWQPGYTASQMPTPLAGEDLRGSASPGLGGMMPRSGGWPGGAQGAAPAPWGPAAVAVDNAGMPGAWLQPAAGAGATPGMGAGTPTGSPMMPAGLEPFPQLFMPASPGPAANAGVMHPMQMPAPGVAPGGQAGTAHGAPPAAASDDVRALSASSPLGRARTRAQGVIGQLRKLLVDRIAGFDPEHGVDASSALAQALTVQQSQIRTQVQDTTAAGHSGLVAYDNAAVQQVARDLRERTGELKQQATTSSEKAVIEIVALMFQSILAEERIPPAVRVWFARLQMPVLRVALSEPEFFSSLQHPARQLIDRMGSCVLGFDAAAIGGSALEVEIRRVVQMIEQYPETGRKVFQLAFDEFQKFLARFLTERGDTRRLVTVAQQVEQKETMSVRYTIELRKMLEGMPVRDEIRTYLFKVWAEVLAVAAVKNGSQHPDTLALKKSASELVWAASAKPNRAERAQVIQGLPQLLQRLRQGMSLLGLEPAEQERHIKVIGDTLADAFQSKTAAIPAASIEAIARRLANLEEFVGQDAEGDLPLVAESIELMLGLDSTGIEVITDGGAAPNAAMLAWARELQPGTWFSLDHNGQLHQVQYAWRSERAQLHLFASMTGRSFLIQVGRLAAYLQAGLVLPAEEEALTVRATREALAKIDANPERLFA